jgi:hypothetical protein
MQSERSAQCSIPSCTKNEADQLDFGACCLLFLRLCRTVPALLAVREAVLLQVGDMVRSLGGPSKVPAAEVLFAFECFDVKDNILRVFFLHLASCTARAGLLEPRYNFIMCEPEDGTTVTSLGEGRGFTVRFVSRPFVAPRARRGPPRLAALRSPFTEVRDGAFEHLTEEAFLAILLAVPGFHSVAGAVLATHRLSGDTHRAEGLKPGVPVLVASISEPESEVEGAGGSGASALGAVDWLQDDEEAEESGQGEANAGVHVQTPEPKSGNGIVIDDELQALFAGDLEASIVIADISGILVSDTPDGNPTDNASCLNAYAAASEEVQDALAADVPGGDENAHPVFNGADAPPLAPPIGYAGIPLHMAMTLGTEDMTEVQHVLGIKVCDRLRIVAARGDVERDRPLGVIRSIMGRVLKSSCHLHSKCELMLNAEGRWNTVLATLVKWQCAGWGQTVETHLNQRDELRLRFRRGV